MLTARSEHESVTIDWFSEDAWHESVAFARHEREQRGESYTARHRRSSYDDADTEDATQRNA